MKIDKEFIRESVFQKYFRNSLMQLFAMLIKRNTRFLKTRFTFERLSSEN